MRQAFPVLLCDGCSRVSTSTLFHTFTNSIPPADFSAVVWHGRPVLESLSLGLLRIARGSKDRSKGRYAVILVSFGRKN